MFLFKKSSPKPLTEVDDLYKKIFSNFTTLNRIDYCESLIYRTKNDLSHTRCPIKKKKLKTLLKAANAEIKYLK
ncbi:hypothetical protein [Aquimarina sp. 2201CG5-10]|uniref:hypothetical protein n=1 Tax=Aquimarina callyspongiae TaxID=3098150 RepID=UPI002AB33304|nr:hypothetical protein [Aquimarina sp. 2201CG5-10]MDY8134633.1 hypothetical protein [Aquimarina sp. 2201CG5-10]